MAPGSIHSPVSRVLSGRTAKVLGLLLALFSLYKTWDYGQTKPGLDFYQFWAVGRELSPGKRTDLYSDAARAAIGSEFLQRSKESRSPRFQYVAQTRPVLQTYSTPLLYSVFKVFSLGDYDLAYSLYQAFCTVCLVLAVGAMARLAGFSFVPSTLLLAYTLLFFEPYRAEARVANVNQLQVAFLALFLWFQGRVGLKHRYFFGGAVLGALVMFKPNLLFVIAVLSFSWLLDRQFKKAAQEYAGMALGALLSFLFSCWMLGSLDCWWDWLSAVRAIPPDITPIEHGNYSLTRFFLDGFGIDVSRGLAAGLAAVVLFFLWRGRRKGGEGTETEGGEGLRDGLLAGVGCLFYLIYADLVWLHYYLLSLPAAIFLLRPCGAQDPRRTAIRWGLAALAFLLLSLDPVSVLFHFRTGGSVVAALVTGTLLLFGLAMASLVEKPSGTTAVVEVEGGQPPSGEQRG